MKRLLPVLALLAISGILISDTIDLNNLINYAGNDIPVYILKDNTRGNTLTNIGATLGRVLFYDKNLSANKTLSCGTCHQQQFAFGDGAAQSTGLAGGFTGRHSMRLVNAAFSDEVRFFWDERAESLEAQTTRPVQDHVEMGFSGLNGDPSFSDLIARLDTIPYYKELFSRTFGDPEITETRVQRALAQFIRSFRSFDSRFDQGFIASNFNIGPPFANFTPLENQGKQLFLAPPANGGAGCAGCHRPPEFDIDPQSRNNGVISVAGFPDSIDLGNTKAPTLRDVVRAGGQLNGPLMHDGSFTTLAQVIDHYNQIPANPLNTNLDPRLFPNGQPQNLNLSQQQKNALVAFLQTLAGSDIYTNEKWSDPFDESGTLTLLGSTVGIRDNIPTISISPNPAAERITISGISRNTGLSIISGEGKLVYSADDVPQTLVLDLVSYPSGVYFIVLNGNQQRVLHKFIRSQRL